LGKTRHELRVWVLGFVVLLLGGCSAFFGSALRPENAILFIGDGMGAEQLRAASCYATGNDAGLYIQALPIITEVSTRSATSSITDSAAAATAMATGRKVQNRAISVDLPGSGEDLLTILEIARDRGLATGLVTTTFLTHATPAAFAAHVYDRSDYDDIAIDYVSGSRPNVLFGGGANGLSAQMLQAAGYEVAHDSASLVAVVAGEGDSVAALIGDSHLEYVYDGRPSSTPSLLEMTTAALEVLARDPDGFLLVVEAGRIDHAAHQNDLARMIAEVLELDGVVRAVAEDQGLSASTTIVVTGDHETGGLSVLHPAEAGSLPEVSWGSTGHTSADVPLYAGGFSPHYWSSARDNTQVFFRLRWLLRL
jgi:alkaline phosphatase